jgi:regulatory protein
MKISQIKKQKKHNLYDVYIDGKPEFTISSKARKKFQPEVGQELNPEELERLKSDIEKFKFEEALLNFLQYRMRSEKEVIFRLKGKHCPEDVISDLLAKYKRLGYIDDQAFAETYLLDLISRHPQGKSMLVQKLKEKGISRETIEQLSAKYLTKETELELAIRLLSHNKWKFDNLAPKEREKKVYAFIARKGFSFYIAKGALENVYGLDA